MENDQRYYPYNHVHHSYLLSELGLMTIMELKAWAPVPSLMDKVLKMELLALTHP